MKRLSVFATLLFAACASTMPANDAEEAIRKMDREFGAAARAGNVDGMMAIYAADAVLMPPNFPAFRGRDAIRQFWGGFLSAGQIDATLEADKVIQSCDMATELGHYALKITPKGGGNPIEDNGKFVLVWRKVGGQWRAISDIFNSDRPLPR
jgi:ketosteroid isomerase-like protein